MSTEFPGAGPTGNLGRAAACEFLAPQAGKGTLAIDYSPHRRHSSAVGFQGGLCAPFPGMGKPWSPEAVQSLTDFLKQYPPSELLLADMLEEEIQACFHHEVKGG